MKNFSIPKGMSPNDIDLGKAKFLSGLPKVLGKYPENKEDIDSLLNQMIGKNGLNDTMTFKEISDKDKPSKNRLSEIYQGGLFCDDVIHEE